MIAIVVLAAGAAKRMGFCKQLLLLGGKPLVWRTASAACAAGLGEVIVVVGAQAEQVTQALADLPVKVVNNPHWQEGQSGSVKAGLAAVSSTAAAVIFMPADQPLITPELLRQLVALYQTSGATAAAPCYNGSRGSPVLFDLAKWRERLQQLTGDQGGRSLLTACPQEVALLPVVDGSMLFDADSPADYEKLQQLWSKRRNADAGDESH